MSKESDSPVTGQIQEKITHDYILDLYQLAKDQKYDSREMEQHVAVLETLSQHIGEYLVIDYNDTKQL